MKADKRAALFFADVVSHFFGEGVGDESMELEYDAFLSFGCRAGLLRETKYSVRRHGKAYREEAGMIEGDPLYVLTRDGKALRKVARA